MGTGEKHRPVLLDLLKSRPIPMPVAVEVGVAHGETSEYLLENLPGLTMLMVDPWRVSASEWETQTGKHRQEIKDAACREAIARTDRFANRRLLLRQPSVSAAGCLDRFMMRGMCELVFIDGAHDYESVKEDCRAWWPHVAVGGILCGHDILKIGRAHV